jgi:GH24 family phage-related lysozyme (muramidase)
MELTSAAIELTESEEGYIAHKYWDPYGEVFTIGFGTTTDVLPDMPETCTVAQATQWLLDYMNNSVVPSILEVFAPVNEYELGGLADLGYNAGSGVFREEPMYSALLSKDRQQIANAFMAFDRAADGALLSDLYHRREADAAFFLKLPPYIPTYNYDWFPKKWQHGVKRYDQLRALYHVGKASNKEVVWMHARELQCKTRARSVWLNAVKRHPLKDKKPSWGVDHRGWIYQELLARSKGKYVLPH